MSLLLHRRREWMILGEGEELCTRLTDGVEDGVVRECDGSMFDAIDSDEGWIFVLHMLQRIAHYRVWPLHEELEFEFYEVLLRKNDVE